MKKIILTFHFSLFIFLSHSQSYQYYQWKGFQPGIFCQDSIFACQILNFEVDTQRNVLWIFGDFEGAGTVSSSYIVGYQNNQFLPFPGTGQSLSHADDYVFYNGNLIGCSAGAVWSYNLDSQQLDIIGTFPNSIYDGGVCLAEYKGDLYVGGQFTAIKGPTGGWIPTFSIARWDGVQWHPLGGGLLGGDPVVNDMLVYQNKLCIGGLFETAGGINAWNIAAWDSTNWNNLWTGTGGYGTNQINNQYYSAEIKDMELFQNNLYIIGDIDSVCGIPAHLAYWNGVNWTGTSYPVHAFFFKSFLNHLLVYSFENGAKIDWWENNQMIPVDSQFVGNSIQIMETFNDTLFAGGTFEYSAATACFKLARLVYDSTNVGTGKVISSSRNEINVYPNPATEQLTIDNGQLTINEIEITDVLGRVVQSLMNKSQSHSLKIDVSEFSSGIYFLSVITNEGISNIKVMKE